MSPKERRKPEIDPTQAVSEIIGAVLLISLVVVAVAIVAVVLTSQSTPEKIPNVNFMTGTNTDGTILYLYHNGGDTLKRGEFAVITDSDPAPRTDYRISDGSDEWSVGKNLILSETIPPKHVSIVYNSGGQAGNVVLKSGSSSVAVLKNNILPDATPGPVSGSGGSGTLDTTNPQNVVNYILSNTSLIADAINQSPTTVGPVVANVVRADGTILFKDQKIDLKTDNLDTYFFRIKITKPGSTISASGFTPNPKSLNVGDIVTVYMRSNSGNYKAFGLGDQLWELTANGVNINISQSGINTKKDNENVYHAWITGYEDLSSTMSVTSTGSNSGNTQLIQYGTVWINAQSNDDDIIVTNIRPVGLGLFVLEWDSSAHLVYFVGNAETVTRNGNVCTATSC
jgi:hypothetical protein